MSAGFADPSEKGPRAWLRGLFAEAKRRARRRRRRQLIPLVGLAAIVGLIVMLTSGSGSGSGGGSGGAAASQSVRGELSSRLQIAEAEARANQNPLGSTPDLHQLLANFAVLRRPQSGADRSWRPQCSCAGSATQLFKLTRFAVTLRHGYRVFLDVERFLQGGQLNTAAGSYMMNLDIVDRYGNTDSTSFGANTQYTVSPLSTQRPGPAAAKSAGGAGYASVVPDGVTKVSWTLGCPRGRRSPDGSKGTGLVTVSVPVVDNVAAAWLSRAAASECPGTTRVSWIGTDGRVLVTFARSGNLTAPPFVKGRLGHGTHPVLTSSGIGGAHIGANAATALRAINNQFGSPADSNVLVPGCSSYRETVWTSPGVAEPLTAYTLNGRFVGYQYGAGSPGLTGPGPGATLATAGGLSLGDKVRAARTIYPAGFTTEASRYVGYWTGVSNGSRFYGAATPDRYPARSVDPGDEISTIAAGGFPECASTPSRTQAFKPVAPGSHASLRARALYYLQLAAVSTRQSGICKSSNRSVAETDNGVPSRSLLSTLAVLRKPLTAADTLPRSLRGNGPNGRFVKYIRMARTVDGVSYYIVPSSSPNQFPALSAACINATMTALRIEAKRIPSAVRAATLGLAARQIAQERLMNARETGDGVCLLFADRHHMSGGTCGATARDLRQWGLISTMRTIAGIVPDGVVAVRVHVPAYDGTRALTVRATVVNDVFVTSIDESPGYQRNPTIAWLSGTGKVIRSIPSRVAGDGNSGWCGGCG